MEIEQVDALKARLQKPKKIVIVPHRSPDGDAMGSTLALQQFLTVQGHHAVVIAPNNYPHFLKWLPGEDEVIRFDKATDEAKKYIDKADFIFTLDFNLLSRAGDMEASLEAAKATFVMIDHHRQPDDYAEFTYSDVTASSTCELVYQFIEKMKEVHQITPEMATCLYAGIMTDTGSFRFSSTSSQTHCIVARLIDKGADNARIHQNIFDTKSEDQLKLLGVALNNLKVFEEYRTAYITLSQKELDTHHFRKGDTEGFVNYGLMLDGIVFAAIFIENAEEGIVKISLRSKGNFDVNTIARKHFNGGGHLNAAGGKSEQPMTETTRYFEEILNTYKDQLQKS